MSSLKVLGIMSGTSLDGVDFVKIKVSKKNLRCEYIGMQSFGFPVDLRRRLFMAAQNEKNVRQLSLLNHDLGRFYAECFKKLRHKLKSIQLIGLHGQTVFHDGKNSTLQIGEPAYLREVSDKPVVFNFRSADIARRGQGAPLAPLFHQAIFNNQKKNISIHNLGGISNLTFLSKGKVVLGFDTGPANMLLDDEVRRFTNKTKSFDFGGQIAQTGKPNHSLLMKMLQFPYFAQVPPKSCGREQFGKEFHEIFSADLNLLSYPDRLATLTELTVHSISKAYQLHCKPYPEKIIFCGGGSKNTFMIKRLQEELSTSEIHVIDKYDWPSQSIEGAACAYLAACRIWNIKFDMKRITGARKKGILGQIA